MFQFLLLFIILSTCLVFLSPKVKGSFYSKGNPYAFVICLFILFILAAFRESTVGNDTIEYLRIFEDSEDMVRYGARYEIGYLYLNYLIYQICPRPQLILIVTSGLILIIQGSIIWKYSKRPNWAFMLFFLLSFSAIVNTIRLCLAISILLCSIESVINRRFLKFTFFVVLASLFHITSIIFLVLYPLSYLKLNGKIIFVFLLLSIIGIAAFASLLDIALSYLGMYEDYMGSMYSDGGARVASFINVFFSLIIFIFSYSIFKKYSSKNWKDSIDGRNFQLFLLMELIALVINLLSLKFNLLDRIGLYFSAVSPIIISNALDHLPLQRRQIAGIAFILLFVVYNCIVILCRPDWNRVYPIELVLFK